MTHSDEFPRPLISWREPKAAARKEFGRGFAIKWYIIMGIPLALFVSGLSHQNITRKGWILLGFFVASWWFGPLIIWFRRGAQVVLTNRSIQYGGFDGHESYYRDLTECRVTPNSFGSCRFFTLEFKGRPDCWPNVPKIEVPDAQLPRVLELLKEKQLKIIDSA